MIVPFSVPGISQINFVLQDDIPNNVIERAQAGLPIGIYAIPHPVTFVGNPTCTCDTSNEHNGRTQTAKLQFKSRQLIPEDQVIVFIVTDQAGQSYLIGNREDPMPLVSMVQHFGIPNGEPRVLNYTIEFTAPNALIPCATVC